ncbi:MAG TPA: adenosylcobinamide-GDP ribazoletransferase [Polyangia bacterium]|nr:adenosylcobinamide-GDP ribazoletransferase [Polyangia bacterium]
MVQSSSQSRLQAIFQATLAAFAFLTRLPTAGAGASVRDADLGRSVAAFPVVGLVLGLALAALGYGLHSRLPPLLLAVFVVALLGALTGGLHLDGFADVFDAVGGGRGDRARMLAIMRDSRIGAHGAAALVLLILAKVFAAAHAIERADYVALLAFPAIGRWTAVPLIVLFPYARREGMGRAFQGGAGRTQLAIAAAVMTIILVALGGRLVLPTLAATAGALAFGLWMRRRLGGLTGDVYGAAIESAEVIVLTVMAIFPSGR